MNDSIKITFAFLGGALLGATLGLLMAPEKGSDTRKKILTKAKGLADGITDAAREKYNELLHNGQDLMEEAEELFSSQAKKRV